jgi:hypothetical protein
MGARATEWLTAIAKSLRNQGDDIIQEALPRRWVDLIDRLHNEERKRGATALVGKNYT